MMGKIDAGYEKNENKKIAASPAFANTTRLGFRMYLVRNKVTKLMIMKVANGIPFSIAISKRKL
ncbi:hypothetical protein D3C87_1856840 [compost metagenome]